MLLKQKKKMMYAISATTVMVHTCSKCIFFHSIEHEQTTVLGESSTFFSVHGKRNTIQQLLQHLLNRIIKIDAMNINCDLKQCKLNTTNISSTLSQNKIKLRLSLVFSRNHSQWQNAYMVEFPCLHFNLRLTNNINFFTGFLKFL